MRDRGSLIAQSRGLCKWHPRDGGGGWARRPQRRLHPQATAIKSLASPPVDDLAQPESNARMPASHQDLFALLDRLGIETRTVEHEAVFTVEQSRELEKDLPGGHTKNLFLKCKKGNIYLVVALHDAGIDLKSLPKRIGSGRLSFGNADLLAELLGVVPGSVTPFALINDTGAKVNVILDAPMMEHETLNYHPLVNTATTAIKRDDLLRFIRATGHDPVIMAVSSPAGQA